MSSWTQALGGSGGNAFEHKCADGDHVVKIGGRGGQHLDQIRVTCGNSTTPFVAGGGGGNNIDDLECADGLMPDQITAGSFIDGYQVTCPSTGKIQKFHGGGGTLNPATCPTGSVISGVKGRSGDWLDNLAFNCSPKPAAATPTAPVAPPATTEPPAISDDLPEEPTDAPLPDPVDDGASADGSYSTATIIGISAGAVACIVLIVGGIYLLTRKRVVPLPSPLTGSV